VTGTAVGNSLIDIVRVAAGVDHEVVGGLPANASFGFGSLW